ncbi:WD40 repeat-containing protein [Heterostelium album PN500]|uniref:Protein transport protein SEC31 n=1 Tax=Heterostelium pallidum (strain ATCC 26659 / Pp 5 / PN500) TaxID=670386 RepID=D3BUT9_HETP5|nr:WD40 repeat-containing protein [Heterostelium album PN500]EFA74877.1 WD40 repeat-containing protein [Heterostelium album PN500]|eukprot:XP_020427011.1 WD40 repeat-containing protein [Heterostelium album PN500]
MSKLKEIQKQATFAWSPLVDKPDLMATGTVAGTIGLDFDTSSKLELYSLDITGQSPQMTLKGTVNADSRFHKLVWLPSHAGQPNGLVVGGMENGSIGIWNPSKILAGEDAHVGTGQKHSGPVQALDYNIVQPNLIASGGNDSELFIWDLSNPSSPSAYSPGNKAQQSEITSISWNRKVQHIIASAYYNGNTYVWDLKARRSIINFSDRNRKCSTRSILWNPNEATSIVTASEDDDHPVIQTWDLRYINTPLKTLEGHRRGVWGLSWCPFDSSLLLSCGKDNRTICWNIEKGEILCEFESSTDSNHWNFDVQWSPRIPAVVATSSFGGNINAFSLQDVNPRAATPAPNALGVVEPVAAPLFKHTPSWLQRPVGAAFGFGGKIAVFGRRKPVGTSPGAPGTVAAQQRTIHISQVVTEQGLLERADKLENVLKQRNYEQFCEEKINASTSAEEKATWGFLKVLFDESSRKKILNYLGHDVESTQNELQNFLKTLPELKISSGDKENKQDSQQQQEDEQQQPTENGDNNSTEGGEKKDVFSLFKSSTDELPLEVVKNLNIVPISFPKDGDEQLITRSLLIGDFATAVQCCLRLGRMADALILASCGSTDLWKKTQQAYFEIEQRPFTRVLSCIAREDFATLVQSADLKDWKSTLSILCTYGTEENFKRLAGVLGDRLDAADDTEAATLCYICACDIDKTVNIWTRSHASNKESSNSELLNLIEKVSIFRSATNSTTLSNDTLASKYSKYAEILASQGHLTDSLRYLSALNTTHPSSDPSGLVLLDRVYRAAPNVQGIAPPPFPFPIVDVYPSGGAPRTQFQQPIQNQQQQQQQQHHSNNQ